MAVPSPCSTPRLAVGAWHLVGAGALITAVLGFQLRAMLGPYEDWPFTSAPMFARYHTAGDPVFELHVVVRLLNGEAVLLQPHQHLGVGELPFRRQLFDKYYGSTDPYHPYGHHPADSRPLFAERMKRTLKSTARAFEEQTRQRVGSARLEVWRFDSQGTTVRPVAEYVASSDGVQLLWSPGAADE